MESSTLRTFRRKMSNPLHWRKANRIIRQYTREDLQSLDRTQHLITALATELDVPLSIDEQVAAAQWLVNQRMNPQSKLDRLSIWKKAK